jgi:hypothetical protein
LLAVRLFDEFLSALEEIARWEADSIEKARLDLIRCLNRAIFENVENVDWVCLEVLTDQNGAMARDRVFLCAKQSDPMCVQAATKAYQSFLKGWEFRNQLIASLFALIALSLRTASSQFPSHEDILDAVPFQSLRKKFSVELAVKPAVRLRTHVRYRSDPMLGEQRHERRQFMIGVTDGVKARA